MSSRPNNALQRDAHGVAKRSSARAPERGRWESPKTPLNLIAVFPTPEFDWTIVGPNPLVGK